MKTLFAIAAAVLLLPAPSRAQQEPEPTREEYQEPPKRGYDYRKRDMNKAERLLGDEAEYDSLDPKTKYIIAQKLADKLRKARKSGKLTFKKVGGKTTLAWKKSKFKSVSIKNLKAEDSDLDSLIRANPQIKDIVVKREWSEETPAQPGVMVPKVVEGMPLGKLFADNDWEVLSNSEHAQELRDLVEKTVDEMGPKGMITGMTVYSSASRLRNTGKAENLSFYELSLKRALAARDFVRDYLKAKYGIAVPDDKVEIDAEGDNGDGTSGPEWDPGKPREPYDVYKFVRVDIDAVAFEETPGTPEEEDLAAQIVGAEFKEKTKSWKVAFPRIRVQRKFQWGRRKGGKRKFKSLPCPDWS